MDYWIDGHVAVTNAVLAVVRDNQSLVDDYLERLAVAETKSISEDPAPPFSTAKLVEHDTHVVRDPECPVCWTVAHMHELSEAK